MKNELLFKLKTLMFMRVFIISVLLSTVILFQLRVSYHPSTVPISSIIILTYLFTIGYAIFLPVIGRLKLFCYIQILIDLLIETGIIYYTGGVGSPFTFLYTLSIFSGSILLLRPGGYTIASITSILYGLSTNLELYGITHPISLYQTDSFHPPEFVLYDVSLNIAVFYMIAFLSGYLAESLRKADKELELRTDDLTLLKNFHENVLENMGGGLIASDNSGRIISHNRAAEIITGCKGKALQQKNIKDLFVFHPDKTLNFENISCWPARLEGFFVGTQQKKIFLGITISKLKDIHKSVSGYIILFQDISNIKQMEGRIAAVERQAAIGKMASGIAHEIRNPLASMSGSIQVLQDRLELNNTDKRLMDIIMRETKRLNSKITDFLQYATPSPLKKKSFLLDPLIYDTITLLNNSPDLNAEIIIVNKCFGKNISIIGDEKQIRQVVWNLCLNSIQAMNKKGGKLEIDSVASERNKSVTITVSDTGEGIQDINRAKIYDPFYTTKESGSGLGLSSVYRIVHDHKGTIRLTSEVGGGTKATVILPEL